MILEVKKEGVRLPANNYCAGGVGNFGEVEGHGSPRAQGTGPIFVWVKSEFLITSRDASGGER